MVTWTAADLALLYCCLRSQRKGQRGWHYPWRVMIQHKVRMRHCRRIIAVAGDMQVDAGTYMAAQFVTTTVVDCQAWYHLNYVPLGAMGTDAARRRVNRHIFGNCREWRARVLGCLDLVRTTQDPDIIELLSAGHIHLSAVMATRIPPVTLWDDDLGREAEALTVLWYDPWLWRTVCERLQAPDPFRWLRSACLGAGRSATPGPVMHRVRGVLARRRDRV